MNEIPDTMPWDQVALPTHLRKPEFRGKGSAQPQPAKAVPALRPAVPTKDSQPPEIHTARRTEIPATYLSLEPKPLSAYDDNVVLNEQGAAFIVGVSADLLKKWRQRLQGPDYLQYGKDGPVRYELKALLAFRDCHRVHLSRR